MIIITGASHTGKTVLAQRMLEKYQKPSEISKVKYTPWKPGAP